MTMEKVLVSAADITRVQPLSKTICDNYFVCILLLFSFLLGG